MHGVLHAVRPEHAGLSPIEIMTELLAFAKDARAGQTSEPLCDNASRHFDLERLPRFRREAHTALSETVRGNFVAVPGNPKPGLASQQLRQIKGDDAGVVREELHIVR